MWNSLNRDLFHNVCSYLDNTSLREVDGVCHLWRNIVRDRVVYVRKGNSGLGETVFSSLQQAVDNSPDFTTIIIQSPLTSKTVISNRILRITTCGEIIRAEVNDPVLCVFVSSVIQITNAHFYVQSNSTQHTSPLSTVFKVVRSTIKASNVVFQADEESHCQCMSITLPTLNFHNVQFHGFSHSISSTYHSQVTPPSPYLRSLEANSSYLSFTHCSFIHQTSQSLLITDQSLSLHDCVFEGLSSHSHFHSRRQPEDQKHYCAIEFAVRFTTGSAKLCQCQIRGFSIGYQGDGSSSLQDCSIQSCKQAGVVFSSSSSSSLFLLQITGGEIGRCNKGIIATESLVSLSKVHLFHCRENAIACTRCLTVSLCTLCIHDCRGHGVFVTEGDCLVCSDCSVYNCKTGLGAHALKHLCLTGNHFMYTDVYALDFWGDFISAQFIGNTIVVNTRNGQLQQPRQVVSFTLWEMEDNVIISEQNVGETVFDMGDCRKVIQTVQINPIAREKGLFINDITTLYSIKLPLSLAVLPVVAGILCTAAFFFKHWIVCSQVSFVCFSDGIVCYWFTL